MHDVFWVRRQKWKQRVNTQRDLNLALCQHLFSQMLLVFANATIPSANSLLLAHHDVLGNFIKKSVVHSRSAIINGCQGQRMRYYEPEIVRNHHDTSTKRVYCVR